MRSMKIIPDVEGFLLEGSLSAPDQADLQSSTDSGKQADMLLYGGFTPGLSSWPLPFSSHYVISAIIHLKANRIWVPDVVTAERSLAVLWIIQEYISPL